MALLGAAQMYELGGKFTFSAISIHGAEDMEKPIRK